MFRFTALCATVLIMAATAFGAHDSTEVGFAWLSIHYVEPGVMREDGSLYGVRLSQTVSSSNMQFRASASFLTGKPTYDGGRYGEGGSFIPIKRSTENTLMQIRAVGIWWMEDVTGESRWGPYIGAGYRVLVDDLPTQWGYTREQTYWYVPVGLETEIACGDNIYCGARAEYDFMASTYNVSAGDMFAQDDAYGYQVFVYVMKRNESPDGFSFMLEAFFRYWDVDDSSVSGSGFYEPANDSDNYGLVLSALF